jgi:transcriptional regulator with XRE-family HTH domain
MSDDSTLVPRHLTRQEFARRVYSLMLEKGWTQSELARRSDLNRDAISNYTRGVTLPSPLSLQKLADGLGVKPEELLPNHTESAIENDWPSFEFRESPAKPGVAWVRVNRLVRTATALKIGALLADDDATLN